MRLLLLLVSITVLSEAKKRRPDKKKIEKKIETEISDGGKYVPVPFGHIFREGFEPNSKQPIDLLELDEKHQVELAEMRKKAIEESQKFEPPKGEMSPKDALYFSEKALKNKETGLDSADKKSGKDDSPWLDLAGTHTRNLGMTRRRFHDTNPILSPQTQQAKPEPVDANQRKEPFFSKKSFGIGRPKKKDMKYINWTKCDDFGRNADFHPKDVVNIDWVPFYTWSSKDLERPVAFIHRFSDPTLKMVQKYKIELGPYLNTSVNWDEPKLHLKSDVEMLLVAADRRGLFDAIPHNEVPSTLKSSKITLPTVKLRLKIVDPYLAMMFCDVRYATIMAISGNEPTTINDIRSEAATLKFKGRGYPVARDLERERNAAELERETRLERERDKYIEAEEIIEGRFPFE